MYSIEGFVEVYVALVDDLLAFSSPGGEECVDEGCVYCAAAAGEGELIYSYAASLGAESEEALVDHSFDLFRNVVG